MSRSIHTLLNELWLYSRAAYCRYNGTHTTYTHMDVQIKFTLEIISYHMRSWWIMADDNWSAKTYSIQFQAKETSNQSNCVVSTLSNEDLTLTKWSFSATIHQSHSFARSLPLTHSPHLTSMQRNATSTQSIIQSDYSLIHEHIDLGLHSLIHTLLHSLIHSHNFTHPLPHLIVHAFHHSPTDLLVLSFPRSKIHSLTQLFTPSRNNPIIHSLSYSFKYSRIIHFFIHSPNN